MGLWVQITHCIVAVFRLSTVEVPGVPWDRQRVLQEFDLGDLLKTLSKRWEQAPEAAGLEIGLESGPDDNVWYHTKKIFMIYLNCWETRILPKIGAEANKPGADGMVDHPVGNAFNIPDSQQLETIDFFDVNMDLFEEAWMKDVLGGGLGTVRDLIEPYF